MGIMGMFLFIPLTSIFYTLFKTYEDLNAYCENNFIEENVSRSCGTLSGTDVSAVDGISLVYTSVINNTTRVNSITGNIIE